MRWIVAALFAMLALPAAAEPPVPLLWKAEKDAGTVYLLGSFHVLKPSDYPLAPAVEAAYSDAEKVLFEVPPSAMASPELAATAQRYAKFDDGRTLRSVLQPDTTAKLQRFLGSEAALAAADVYEPWYMSMNLAVMALMQAGFDPTKGLDLHLMQRSAKDAKPTAGLETVEDQLRALDATPLAEQEKGLADALKSMPELRSKIDELHAQWRAGDAAAMDTGLAGEMRRDTPESYRLLNVERNQRWLPQVEALLAEKNDHLVVVGSLHLLGKDGLVEQLAARGVRVERVEPSP